MSLTKACFSFFDDHIDPKKPILLGLSGGADSIFLFHLLLAWRAKNPVDLHIVHVDHGWRAESANECQSLNQLAKKHGLTFHSARLDPCHYRGNLEAESRKERFAFFDEVQRRVHAQGILLAHHAGDVAETVFKRVFEGASLRALSGIKPCTNIGTLSIIRPLLEVSKEEILAYLMAEGITYFEDASNYDLKFLRAKMRVTIFPFLKEQFGKGFEGNLCNFAKDMQGLCSYMDKTIDPYIPAIQNGPFGMLVDTLPIDSFELSWFIKKIAPELSRQQRAILCTLLQKKKANSSVVTKELEYIADRGVLCIVPITRLKLPPPQNLVYGTQLFGPYEVTVTDCSKASQIKNHWKELFLGKSCAILPRGSYQISPVWAGMRRGNKDLRRLFTEKKVPNFLQGQIPVIVQDGVVVEDFVTADFVQSSPDIMITICAF